MSPSPLRFSSGESPFIIPAYCSTIWFTKFTVYGIWPACSFVNYLLIVSFGIPAFIRRICRLAIVPFVLVHLYVLFRIDVRVPASSNGRRRQQVSDFDPSEGARPLCNRCSGSRSKWRDVFDTIYHLAKDRPPSSLPYR